mmetsp:Transcript_24263/g.79100  ORF Transcript_24263/g.79100 Transcript_24263/m.79100 type:complete len:126 (-) Transcript_24263:279-656(-)
MPLLWLVLRDFSIALLTSLHESDSRTLTRVLNAPCRSHRSSRKQEHARLGARQLLDRPPPALCRCLLQVCLSSTQTQQMQGTVRLVSSEDMTEQVSLSDPSTASTGCCVPFLLRRCSSMVVLLSR